MVIRLMMTVILWLGLLTPEAAIAMPLVTAPSNFLPNPPSTTVIALQGRLFSLPGQQPGSIGVQDGQLADCPSTPNCVSTTATDPEHAIEPIRYSNDAVTALAGIKKIVADLPRAEIIDSDAQYLYVQFTSEWLGFVDDVEFAAIPEQQQIAVRSTSRLGESDLGVNRKRVERIRTAFTAGSAQQSRLPITAPPITAPELQPDPAVQDTEQRTDLSEVSVTTTTSAASPNTVGSLPAPEPELTVLDAPNPELGSPTPDPSELELLTEVAGDLEDPSVLGAEQVGIDLMDTDTSAADSASDQAISGVLLKAAAVEGLSE